MFSSSVCLLLGYRKTIDMCKLIPYPATLLNLFLLVGSLVYSSTMSSVNSPVCMLLFSFSCLPVATSTWSRWACTHEKGRGSGHPCLRLDLRGKSHSSRLGWYWLLWRVMFPLALHSLTFVMKACWICQRPFLSPLRWSCDRQNADLVLDFLTMQISLPECCKCCAYCLENFLFCLIPCL